MRNIILALQFLTVVPFKHTMFTETSDLAKSSSAFVFVGLLQGLLLTFADYSAGHLFDQDLVIGIVLLTLVVSSGGLHLDGLADTFDAIAARGDRQKKLSVMKGGSVGPTGAIAVLFALALKFLALKNLSSFSFPVFYSSLLLMPVFSKWALVISMYHGKPARTMGLGKIFLGGIGGKEMSLATITLFLSLFGAQIFFDHTLSPAHCWYGVISAIVLYLFSRLAIRFFTDRFGGLTGDTLGAISEGSEIIFLFGGITWSRFFV